MLKRKLLPIAIFNGSRGEGDESFTQEQLDTAIAAAVTKANDEAMAKFNETKTGLLGDLKKAKDAAKRFDGIDPDSVKTMMAAFEDNQDLKDISEGKHEEVINRRIEKERAKFTSDVNALAEKSSTLEEQNVGLVKKVSKLLIDNNVVSEFIKEKGVEGAIPDVVLRANQVFKVEGDDLIPRDSKGEIISGKNGPMTISEWVSGLKEDAAHLFPSSSGSGAGGGGHKGDKTGMEAKIAKAAEQGDMKEYRRLRKLQGEGKTG